MSKVLIIFITSLFLNSTALAINIYKYPDKDLDENLCSNILEKLNSPSFPYSKNEPITVEVDLEIEDIHEISGKNLDFETSYAMWLQWKDDSLIKVLKELGVFTNKGKPLYLCDYTPKTIIGENRKIFDPVVEFFNIKEKPNFESGLQDWIEIFSDGTVQSRIRDTKIFKGYFNFKNFPFDKQDLSFEIWSEFPSSMVRIIAEEPVMSQYKENLYSFSVENEGISIPGWDLVGMNYENYTVSENDGFEYSGLVVNLEVERQSAYYLFKIILPIIFILAISWSVFWVRGSQLEAKVNITIVCLLSLIAYNFIIDEDLPKLSYLTFLDSFILLSYFYTGIATILCVYSFVKKMTSGADISFVDLKARWIGPLSYFGILILTLVYFYNLEGSLALFRL